MDASLEEAARVLEVEIRRLCTARRSLRSRRTHGAVPAAKQTVDDKHSPRGAAEGVAGAEVAEAAEVAGINAVEGALHQRGRDPKCDSLGGGGRVDHTETSAPEGPRPSAGRAAACEPAAAGDAAAGVDSAEREHSTPPALIRAKRARTLLPSHERRPSLRKSPRVELRDRKFIGSILSHLTKARATLEQESTTAAAAHKREAERRAEARIAEQRRAVADRQRALEEAAEAARLAELDRVTQELEVAEARLLANRLHAHFRRMKGFVQTKTFPTLFWKPAVRSGFTDKMQEETDRRIERKIQSVLEKSATSCSPASSGGRSSSTGDSANVK